MNVPGEKTSEKQKQQGVENIFVTALWEINV
jgi:hypothetical protein